jgi:DNA-binding XRE family transcriptional regulator
MRLASLLKAWRHHEHMSIREAAERIGIPPSTYMGIEKGKSTGSDTLAHILCWMLGAEFPC